MKGGVLSCREAAKFNIIFEPLENNREIGQNHITNKVRSHPNHLNSILQLNIVDIDVTHSSVEMPMTSKCLDNTDIDLILSKCSDELPVTGCEGCCASADGC